MDSKKPLGLIHALADGLTGYMTYESRCGMSEAYNEYYIYYPIVRIANHLSWRVKSEWPHMKGSQFDKGGPGDHKRIDFLFSMEDKEEKTNKTISWVALEVKWTKQQLRSMDVEKDVAKLKQAKRIYSKEKKLRAFLLIVGPHEVKGADSKLKAMLTGLPEESKAIYSKGYKATSPHSYGVTIFEII